MKLQTSPNNWSCAAVSLAMALDQPYQRIIDLCGHDGSAKVWRPPYEDLHEGFHIHELIDIAWTRFMKPVTPFVRTPTVTPSLDHPAQNAIFRHHMHTERRFLARIFNCVGMMTGFTNKAGKLSTHAVAWDGTQIYDPRGYSYHFDSRIKYSFDPDVFWMVGGKDVSAFTVVP